MNNAAIRQTRNVTEIEDEPGSILGKKNVHHKPLSAHSTPRSLSAGAGKEKERMRGRIHARFVNLN